MDAPSPRDTPPFGRVLTAMVTPFTAEGGLDLDGAQVLARHLVDEGNDGLVLNGTTGEAPTTRAKEKADLIRAVVEAVGERCSIVAGVGSNDTAHSVSMAREAAAAGADGVLVVTPYYNKPPQAGVVAHVQAVADASDRPVMLYDIPGRSAIPMETETIVRLAEHPRVVAMKDAKLDLEATSWVLQRTELAYYSGQDAYTLPILAIGGVGVVGTSTHFTGGGTAAMVQAYLSGDVDTARKHHRQLLPAYTGIFRAQGTVLVKAGLRELGLPSGPVRLPLVEATAEQVAVLRADLEQAGIDLAGVASAAGPSS
jgi:4-hydroxy-tetrahydrodipicolinate synthase